MSALDRSPRLAREPDIDVATLYASIAPATKAAPRSPEAMQPAYYRLTQRLGIRRIIRATNGANVLHEHALPLLADLARN